MTAERQARIARLISGAACIAGAAAGVPSAYLALLTSVAASNSHRRPRPSSGTTRFVVCIPAHNEATVIERSVCALRAQRYPSAMFTVHVVADNCTDGTIDVAAGAGATVHERVDPKNPGKGPALNWLANELAAIEFDVLVVIDADTVADPGFLAAIDCAIASGASVAQGFYGVEDPHGSAAVGLRFAAIACRHHLRPLARNALGASSGLYGNGMAFRAELLEDRHWSNHLIEDAEFQIELLLDGHLVTYVPDAMLRAEMPETLDGSRSQNERWELGRLQIARQYLPSLIHRTVTGRRHPRRVYVDAIADIASPPLSVQALLDLTAVVLATGAVMISPNRQNRVLLGFGLASSAALVSHVLVALRLVSAPPEVYRSLRSAPRTVVWKVMLLTRIARRPHSVTWTRTARNADEGSAQ